MKMPKSMFDIPNIQRVLYRMAMLHVGHEFIEPLRNRNHTLKSWDECFQFYCGTLYLHFNDQTTITKGEYGYTMDSKMVHIDFPGIQKEIENFENK